MRETYDSNVFLQDTEPSQAVAGAVPACLGSLISSATAIFSLDGRLAPDLVFSTSYAPEASFYHAAPTEDNLAHRTNLTMVGGSGDLTWSLANTAAWIDGSKDAPIFGGPGGAPALGGAPVRDRRDAFVERGSFKLTALSGPWLVRGAASAYWHDFRTRQTRLSGCSNYIDRSELLAGLDAGYAVLSGTRLIAGFRYGRQTQGVLLGTNSAYDSWIRRFIVGLEGSPVRWIQLNLLTGVETRSFSIGTPPGFDRHQALVWADASATMNPTKRDTFTLCYRRIEQPASSSVSLYIDTTAEATWRHQWAERWSVGAVFKLLGGTWRMPSVRRDLIYSPGVQLTYTASPRSRVELACVGDVAHSLVPATAGREFRRFGSSITWTFTL